MASRAEFSSRLLSNSEKQLPRGLKPARNDKNKHLFGTAEAVPFQNALGLEFFSSLLGFLCVSVFLLWAYSNPYRAEKVAPTARAR